MNISDEGVDLIEAFEGLRLTAYQDVGGIWTIGYGHTGNGVYSGLTITEDQAEALLLADLSKFENIINAYIKVSLAQNQFDALISFTYNVGGENFESSTLLKDVNASDFTSAADQFLRWDLVHGQVVEGLLNRRNAERALFLGEDWRSFVDQKG
jgi:lysozyme